MNVLIVDSGSTKTDWAIVSRDGALINRFTTVGINPILQTETEIIANLQIFDLDHCGLSSVTEAYFYGAGCATERESLIIRHALQQLGVRCYVFVYSDILGAARALLLRNEGIAGILGTGCNSCLYDGKDIVRSVPPLGYLLGDEGSGSYIGKYFLANIYKGVYTPELCELFFEEYPDLNRAEMMNQVYRRPYPNRFMASFLPFIKKMERFPQVKELLHSSFDAFFKRNILLYGEPSRVVVMIGSIAYFFEEYLVMAATNNKICVQEVARSPMEGLIKFHLSK